MLVCIRVIKEGGITRSPAATSTTSKMPTPMPSGGWNVSIYATRHWAPCANPQRACRGKYAVERFSFFLEGGGDYTSMKSGQEEDAD